MFLLNTLLNEIDKDVLVPNIRIKRSPAIRICCIESV